MFTGFILKLYVSRTLQLSESINSRNLNTLRGSFFCFETILESRLRLVTSRCVIRSLAGKRSVRSERRDASASVSVRRRLLLAAKASRRLGCRKIREMGTPVKLASFENGMRGKNIARRRRHDARRFAPGKRVVLFIGSQERRRLHDLRRFAHR